LRSIKGHRKKGDGELLDRLVPVNGLNRSYLATALGKYDRNKEALKPGAKNKRAVRPEGVRNQGCKHDAVCPNALEKPNSCENPL
jgi:hypothetical protein